MEVREWMQWMPDPGERHRTPPREVRDWALLVYIAGDDTKLSNYGLKDVEELSREGTSSRVHAAVELDTIGELDGAICYEITENDGERGYRTVIARLPERDSGSPEVLQEFLRWGLRRYPAHHTAVVIWGHGSGFRQRPRNVATDHFGTSLDMIEIGEVFGAVGIGEKAGQKKLSVLGFDACLMSMIEIAHQFRGQVGVLVGSQQNEPGDGWPYSEVLRSVKQCECASDLGKRIVACYVDHYKEIGHANVTQSAIDLERIAEAVHAVHDLGLALKKEMGANASKIRDVRTKVQTFYYADYVDLIDLAQRLESEAIAVAEAERVVDTVRHCILNPAASGRHGDAVQNANGLSIWYPNSGELYDLYRSKYAALQFARDESGKDAGWLQFLDTYRLTRPD